MGAPRVHKTQNGNLVLRLAYEIEVRGSLLHMFCSSVEGICHERFNTVSHQGSLAYEIHRSIPCNI